MKTRITNIAAFQAIVANDLLVLEGKRTGIPRVAAFDISTSGPVDIFKVIDSGELQFLVSVDGYQTVELTILETSEIMFVFGEDTYCNVRLHSTSQRIEKMSGEKFTSLDRRPTRNSELDRMMMMMKHNFEELRIKQEQETDRKIAAIKATVSKPKENSNEPRKETQKPATKGATDEKGPKPSTTTDTDGADATKPVAGGES